VTLSLVPPPPRPDIRPPTGAWFPWFANETAPLAHSGMRTSSEFRRRWTKGSPLLFALVYFPHHLKLQGSNPPIVTFNQLHLGLCRASKRWVQPKRWREAWIAPRGIGKALALDTPVLTANRDWTTHGDLRVGDHVFDETGAPVAITDVSERWLDRPCYRITFSDGEQIVADENHEWWVNDRYSDLAERLEDTARISEKWLLTEARGYREVRYSVPVAGALQYLEAQLPIAPYVLGAWLGDGTSSAGALTVGHEDAAHLVAQLRIEGENPVARPGETALTVQLAKPRPHLCPREHSLEPYGSPRPGRGGGRYRPCQICIASFQRVRYGTGTIGPRTNRPLLARLRDAGLLRNKHIPEQYFTASISQRLALLQGLMDTDGSIGLRGTCEITLTNERLIRDVQRLVHTMGIKSTIRESRATIAGVDKGPRWRLTFHTDQPVFRLPRKLERVPAVVRQSNNRRIVNVERVENQATSCITVNSSAGLYLAGRSLVPTHNTSWAFLILPLWALAHGHRNYFMAFSDTTDMANNQLANLRMELDPNSGNALLLQDYPSLRQRRVRGGSNTKSIVVANGGTIRANGLSENTLGAKSGADRPDLLVFDDIEPLESTMSDSERRKRIEAITTKALPMGADHAASIILGTTTSYDSVIDQIAQHARGRKHHAWVANSGITPRIFPAVQVDPLTGQECSIWPERWPLTETHLGQELRRTPEGDVPPEFEKNYLLDPSPYGTEAGSFWRPEMFKRRTSRSFGGVFEHAMYIDVATTSHAKSDRTAIVIVGRDPARRHAVVEYAQAYRIPAEELRQRIHQLCARQPTLRTVVVETNQGGDLWRQMLSPLPAGVRLMTEHVSNSKQDRFEQALQWYMTGRVFHAIEHVELEREMVMFPSKAVNDDLPDAACGALRWAFDK